MSIQTVVLTAADEKYAPPEGEIELQVVGGELFITVYEGTTQTIPEDRKMIFEVPVLDLDDVLSALWSLGRSDQREFAQ